MPLEDQLASDVVAFFSETHNGSRVDAACIGKNRRASRRGEGEHVHIMGIRQTLANLASYARQLAHGGGLYGGAIERRADGRTKTTVVHPDLLGVQVVRPSGRRPPTLEDHVKRRAAAPERSWRPGYLVGAAGCVVG